MNFLATLLDWLREWWPFDKVHQWEKGVRFTYLPSDVIVFENWRLCWKPISARVIMKDLEPGIHRRIPFMEEVHGVSAVQQVYELETQTITTADGISVAFRANIIYEIADVRKSIIEVHDFEHSLKGLAEIHLAQNTRDKTWAHLHMNQDQLEDSLKKTLTKESKRWGTKIIEVGLTTLVPTKSYRLFQSMI